MAVETEPEAGVGITLGYIATGSTYVNCAQLMDDCEFDGFDTTVIPIPTLAAGTLAKTPGRTDCGNFTCSMWLVNADAGVAEMQALRKSKAIIAWQVQLNDGSTETSGSAYQFSGFISNTKPGNFSGDDAPHLDVTIAISGDVTLAPAT